AFTARGTFDDGTVRAVDAIFSASPQAIASIDPAGGTFTATGSAGGKVEVKATLVTGGATFTATAALLVKLEWVTIDPQAPSTVADRFTGTPVTDAARTPDVVYPLDGVVFPQNVAPANVQWLNGTSSDIFRLTF